MKTNAGSSLLKHLPPTSSSPQTEKDVRAVPRWTTRGRSRHQPGHITPPEQLAQGSGASLPMSLRNSSTQWSPHSTDSDESAG